MASTHTHAKRRKLSDFIYSYAREDSPHSSCSSPSLLNELRLGTMRGSSPPPPTGAGLVGVDRFLGEFKRRGEYAWVRSRGLVIGEKETCRTSRPGTGDPAVLNMPEGVCVGSELRSCNSVL